MKSLSKLFSQSYQDIRSNRKLQYGLLAIALIVCVEWGLQWSDSLAAREKQLQQSRSEVRMLRNQSRDEEALRQLLSELDSAQQAVDKRLWVVSSEAVGQAQLKDWLTDLLKKAKVRDFKLVLSSPRVLGQSDRRDQSAGSGTESGSASKDNPKSLRELRANLTMSFTPETLEKVLLDIEGGESLAVVESLTVKRQDRKAEMAVRVLMRIGVAETQKIDAGADAVQRSASQSRPVEDSFTGRGDTVSATGRQVPAPAASGTASPAPTSTTPGARPLQAAEEATGVKK